MTWKKVRDSRSLSAWFSGRDPEVKISEAIMISTRVTLRFLPQFFSDYIQSESKEAILPVFRSLLISSIANQKETAGLFEIAANAGAAVRKFRYVAPDEEPKFPTFAVIANALDISVADALELTEGLSKFAGLHHDDFWGAIVEDCKHLEEQLSLIGGRSLPGNGYPISGPLWPTGKPRWFVQLDAEMRHVWHGQNAKEWVFWERWWEGILSGVPIERELSCKVAQIADHFWDSGLAAVSLEIDKVLTTDAGVDQDTKVISASELLRLALSDYSFDALDRVMRMVPFEEEVRHLREKKRLNEFLDDAGGIRDDLELFLSALAAEGAMQGAGTIRTYFAGVLSELDRAKNANHLRVGRIVELGKILEGFSLDANVATEFGPLAVPLRSHVNTLLNLTRRHFAATLTRMAPLHDISSSPDTDQWDLLQDVQRGIRELSRASPNGRVPLAADDQNVLLSITDSIERLLRQHDIVPTAQARGSLRREIDYQLALVSVSVALFLDRSQQQQAGVRKATDSVLADYTRVTGLLALWEAVKAAIRG